MTVIVTSDYSNLSSGSITGRLGRERRDGSRGRGRMTIEIVSEPIVHNLDELQLGKAPAVAAGRALADKVRSIADIVQPDTQLTRKYQEAAYQRGESWVRSRFGGPRMGPRAPDPASRRYFNHSGTFADSIVATENLTEKSWTVNVAANRLDPRTSRDATQFAFITDALRRLIPEFDDPRRLAQLPEVNEALQGAIEQLIFKASAARDRLRQTRLMTALRALRLDILPKGVQNVILGG